MRLLTEEWIQFKRSNEDEILAAFQTLDVEKKGFLEQVHRPPPPFLSVRLADPS